MLTLYHSPMSRSSRIVTLVQELGASDAVTIETVSIQRQDGSGGSDPANPHPDHKVPALDHDGTLITESAAIALHLCDLFPDSGLLPAPGTPERGKVMEWVSWNAGVVEPVVHAKMLGIDHPGFTSTFRDWDHVIDRITKALDRAPYLVGDHYTVADLMVQSLFNWMPDLLPDHKGTRDWHARVSERPAAQETARRDQQTVQAATAD